MLDKFILTVGYGVSYGSATLKSLQNENIPKLDLLVRESIQNSSDASLSMPGKSYNVNFTTGKFNPRNLNSYLSGVEDDLNARFSSDTADFLEIRDIGTSGLTGCTKKSEIKSDDHGNFFKLIYDTGKRQTQYNAGGNWGFGKSVYYRVGIGIVIYYSRIKTGDTFESRLIITIVEDESKKNIDGTDATILNKLEPNSVGKAWWGIKEKDDILPICDEDYIKKILDIFNLAPFTKEQTGTSIIIPYIDTDELLNDIIPADSYIESGVQAVFMNKWMHTIQDYLKLSIQKWYAPKLHNLELQNFPNKKWLLARVNNVPIRNADMLPFFQLVQELYNTAIAKTYGKAYSSKLPEEIHCEAVNVKNYLKNGMTTGYISIIKIRKDTLNRNKNFLSPYDYIGRFEVDGKNDPIVICTRDPGMILDYPIDGPWVKGIISPEDPNTFLFGFFMPILEKEFKSDLSVSEFAGMQLGEYLRRCEASDHMGWSDPAKMKLVFRIQKNIVTIINDKSSNEKAEEIDATASKLAVKLGKRLLPRIGYGRNKNVPGPGGTNPGGGKISDAVFDIIGQHRFENKMEIDFQLKMMHAKKTADITLLIASEGGGWITPKAWQEDIGTKLPIRIEQININNVSYPDDHSETVNVLCTAERAKDECKNVVSFTLERANGSMEFSSVNIKSDVNNLQIKGKLTISAIDKKYQFTVKVN